MSGDDSEESPKLCVLTASLEPPPPAILTSLLLVTIPRLRRASPLRLLPLELIQLIARYAHKAEYWAAFRAVTPPAGEEITLSNEAMKTVTSFSSVRPWGATSFDLTNSTVNEFVMIRDLLRGVHYVEIFIMRAWYGTRVTLTLGGSSFMQLELGMDESAEHMDSNIVVLNCSENPGGPYRVAALGFDNWIWCAEDDRDEVVLGFLVDMERGCVTFRLNGVDGPCVAFASTSSWRDGVLLSVDDFPGWLCVNGNTRRVSCRTAPCPFADAPMPRTYSQLVESGDLVLDYG
mmetsp:Transcript_5223/g.15494  ORF Transcript_5223/g.15494 Transcript_5223/m.15494 type:complete len:290 (+) Transcript_5223:155-1024(+)